MGLGHLEVIGVAKGTLAYFIGVSCKCTPRQSKKSIFKGNVCWAGERWRVGVINLAVSACVLRTTTKKGHQLFEENIVTPSPRENPGYAYVGEDGSLQHRSRAETTQ